MAMGGVFFGRARATIVAPVFADDDLAVLMLTTGVLFLGKVT
jgi:hypothetical protein